MLTCAIETDRLTKRFGTVAAVTDLTVRVEEGEIYGFLGLNGAGKTTTLRMLLGMIRPTLGSVHLLGTPVRLGRGPWSDVGHLVETPSHYPELTVRENLEVMARLRGGLDRAAVTGTLEQLGLAAYAERRAGTLSLGNAQRLGLAKALLHRPRLLLLDEPANGLDPAGIVEVRELLRRLAREDGATIFMSSHVLGEISRIATRLGILHEGRLIAEVGGQEMEHRQRRRLRIETRDDAAARRALQEAGIPAEAADGGGLDLTAEEAVLRPDEVVKVLVYAGIPPTRVGVESEGLEAYFLRLVTAAPGSRQ
jgi:ABC-2 type transport system ATP-binding protein